MNLKPKTVRRVLLASFVGVFLVGSVFALFVVRHWQNQRLLDTYREEGLAAYQEQDYYTALEKTSFYFRRGHADDADVLLALAESRRRLEEPDNRHLVQSIRPYQLYLEQRPDDEEIRRTLLEVYNKAGYSIEARDLAARMRPQDLSEAGTEHLPILREEAFALVGARAYGPRLDAVLDRILELDPLDIDAHFARLEVMTQLDERSEARRWGDAVLEAHEDDPRAQMIFAASRLVHPVQEEVVEARRWLCRSAGLDPDSARRISPAHYEDSRYAERLVALLEGVRAFAHSRVVLREAAPMFDDLQLQRALVRRLWQEQNYEEVLDLTSHLDAENRQADSELLGFRALALAQLGESALSASISEHLSRRKGDFRAQAWSIAVPLAAENDDTPSRQAVRKLREAASEHPHEPVIQLMLGDRLAALGRTEDARKAWQEAAEMRRATSWPTPWVRIAESLLPDGRVQEALSAANEAITIAPEQVLVNVVWFEAQAALIQSGAETGMAPAALLKRLEEAEAQLETLEQRELAREMGHRLLPCRVVLLSRMGRRDEARSAALTSIEQDLPVHVLRKLSAISVSERLGFEDQLAQHAGNIEGGAAAVAQARAMRLASEGRTGEGLDLLREAIGPSPDREARITIARYKDSAGHPEALTAWRHLGEMYPDDVAVQRACLEARAAAADSAFIERTIERYQQLQGRDSASEDVIVRMARARILLHGRPTRRERDEAVGILGGVVRANPQLAEARVLLASALAHRDRERGIAPDLARAAAQLSEAARLEPRNAGVAIDLARLLLSQGEQAQAHSHLVRIANDERVSTQPRWRAAEMLLSIGDARTARDALAHLAQQLGDEAPGALLASLAQAYQAAGQASRASEIYERLATGAADDARSILATAIHLARHDQKAQAELLLSQLDELELPEGERPFILARFESAVGDPAEAQLHFEEAVKNAPHRADIWRAYAAMDLERGDATAAADVARRGLAQAPGDGELVVIQERARLATAGGDQEPSLAPLAEALRSSDAYGEAARMVSAIESARGRGELQSVSGLRRLADEFPTSAPLQLYVAHRLAMLDPRAAAETAMRAMNIDSDDPEPARMATELFLRLGRWNDMAAAARAWRARAGDSVEADVALAEAQWRTGRPDMGLRTLASRVATASESPEDPISISVLNLQGRMLVLSGREAQARQLLKPLLPGSPEVRRMVWTGLAARDVQSLASAIDWLNEVELHMPPDAADEQLAAALARTMLADRFDNESGRLLEDALSRLRDLVADPNLQSAAAWEALGVVQHRLGEVSDAQEAYRRALDMDADRPVSLNNLANIAAQGRGDLHEALELSRRAVRATSAPDPGHISTLAAIHRQLARQHGQLGRTSEAEQHHRDAAAAFGRLAALRPGDPGPLVERAQSLWAAGDAGGAAEAYERVLQISGLALQLDAVIRNNLAATLRVQGDDPRELERARALVIEAIDTAPQPAFYDTLGWIELDLGRMKEAQAAFQTALELAQADGESLHTAAVGLAWMLMKSGEAEQEEVSRLISGIDSELDERYRARLDEVREVLAADGG